jgi:hypothetical protein
MCIYAFSAGFGLVFASLLAAPQSAFCPRRIQRVCERPEIVADFFFGLVEGVASSNIAAFT